jgi:hypothetical protein
MTRSITVGMPNGRVPPLSFGISTLFTGEGVYVPSRSAALIPPQCLRAYSGNSSTEILSIPGAPLFALTCLYALCRLSLSSTLSHCDKIEGISFHDVPGDSSSGRILRRFRTHVRPPLTSTFGPSVVRRPTMPSADFCLFPLHVAIQGASGLAMITLILTPAA